MVIHTLFYFNNWFGNKCDKKHQRLLDSMSQHFNTLRQIEMI